MHVAEFLKMCCTVVQGPRSFPLTISGLNVLSPYFFRILLHCGRGCLSAGKSAHSQRVEEKMHSPGDDFLQSFGTRLVSNAKKENATFYNHLSFNHASGSIIRSYCSTSGLHMTKNIISNFVKAVGVFST